MKNCKKNIISLNNGKKKNNKSKNTNFLELMINDIFFSKNVSMKVLKTIKSFLFVF